MRLVTVLVVVVVLAARSVVSTSSNVRLVNNGYEGVVVAIAPSVDESFAEDIISSIKETLTKASDDLFKATRRRAFFRRIKILLPKSWNNVIFDQTALNENYEDSDIRVDLRNPVYGDQPYTVQPGGCGEPGRYMHLTPQYLTDNTQADLWGPRGKTVLHEWAKLRWGVFDEFGYPHDPTFPLFYWTSEITADGVNTVYTPNYCANQDLKGELRDLVDGGSCSYVNGLPDEDCRFVPDDVQAASSSFMAYYYINTIVEFCDTATDEKFSHNEFAPNRQNMMCNSRSVWDVIYQHQDFTNGMNPPTNSSASPEFIVVRQEEAKFALVLDYSLSMNDFERIHKLQRTARRWILHEVAEGSFVSIVKFWGSAQRVAELTEITADNRESLANLIDTKTNSYTSIGAGLSLAINDPLVIKDKKNAIILLITDGEETKKPHISDVMTNVINSGARVVTVAFGKDADMALESLAMNTGGKTYSVLDEDDGGMLDEAFLGALTYQPGQSLSNISVKIHEMEYQGANLTVYSTFNVDSSVGRKLQFRLDMDSTNHITSNPYLVSPNGTRITTAVLDSIINMWTIDVALAQTGRWKWSVGLSGDVNNHVRVSVTAQAREPTSMPIYSRAWMSAGAGDVDASANPIIIYAEVKQGNNPVVGARVRAYVSQPDTTARAIELELLDNGQAADNQAGDGVYSRYLTVYSTTGRYAVKAQVWDDGNALINNGFITSRKRSLLPADRTRRALPVDPLERGDYCCGSVVPLDPAAATPTGDFFRFASGGSVQVTQTPTGDDALPPSRVTDLQVTYSHSTMNITWTAPGDDYDSGTVSAYVVRMSGKHSLLMEENFNDAGNDTLLLTQPESENMTNLLLEAGQRISLYLDLKEELHKDEIYYVALRAVDDVNKQSRVSNLALVVVPTADNNNNNNNSLPDWAIALIAIACVVLLGGLVAGIIHQMKKK